MKPLKVNNSLKGIIKHWQYLSHDIYEPHNEADYNKLSKILDVLLDRVGEEKQHPLMGLVDVISHMIAMYDERENDIIKNVSGIEVLKFLMDQHHLTQSDLPEIGSQGVVSEILQGKRKLNINQIKKLSQKFHVSPNTFIDPLF